MKNVLLSLLLCAAATNAMAVDKSLKGEVKLDGSSTVFPIAEAAAEEFQKEYPNVRVTVGLSGTGGGMKKFTAGEIDIANASRKIKGEEEKKATEGKVEFIELPIANDGIAVVVNPSNTFAKSLTLAQLKALWEPGSKVKTWKDLDPSWPANPIKLYGPGADSGTFDFFTEHVMGTARLSRNDYTASEDDNVLVTGVSKDKNALGYFGFAYYIENQKKVRDIPLAGKDGAVVSPNPETIEKGTYTLARPLMIYVNKKSAQKPEVKAFVSFLLKNAAALSKEVGYVPLKESMYTDAIKKFDAAVSGKASH
ncbi:MAG: PstS family phosphate ABC transporter substrate-binding protein [Bdellovibrionota bacterium]|nr:MAG: PstS family phosphate ABC transporter substrate-binding protein [Pseudomonadota bacterium]